MDIRNFNNLARSIGPRLRSAASRWLADAPRGCDTPDDIVQDTLIRLWSIRDRLDGYRDPEALVMVMGRRIALDALRHIGARPSALLTDEIAAPDSAPGPDRLADTAIAEELASSLLDTLPSRQALILRMRHADGLELGEIASITSMTEGNIRVLLSRGRTRLRELYLSSTRTHNR